MKFTSLKFENDKLSFINQTKLPFNEEIIETDSYERIAEAIEKLEIRGAPAIGIAAGYALALGIKNNLNIFEIVYQRLLRTRPTAVNLFNVLSELKNYFHSIPNPSYELILEKVIQLHNEDISSCQNIANNALQLFNKPVSVLTHCNSGALATTGIGTALGIIFELHKKNLIKTVYVDETRPLLQGSRLTAFELEKAEIDFYIITDSMAAYLMQLSKIDIIITGADRIAINGDSANKIGTYSLAVNAKYHNIPFFIAAPETTIDRNIENGSLINIEQRKPEEILNINNHPITKQNYKVFNPAFDVTPAELITAIITDKNIYKPPYNLK